MNTVGLRPYLPGRQIVIAGLDPAIQSRRRGRRMDHRGKPGGDNMNEKNLGIPISYFRTDRRAKA
jgi:hypothetical protein